MSLLLLVRLERERALTLTGPFHQMNFAASAITTIVTITIAAICTQRLFARPLLCVI